MALFPSVLGSSFSKPKLHKISSCSVWFEVSASVLFSESSKLHFNQSGISHSDSIFSSGKLFVSVSAFSEIFSSFFESSVLAWSSSLVQERLHFSQSGTESSSSETSLKSVSWGLSANSSNCSGCAWFSEIFSEEESSSANSSSNDFCSSFSIFTGSEGDFNHSGTSTSFGSSNFWASTWEFSIFGSSVSSFFETSQTSAWLPFNQSGTSHPQEESAFSFTSSASGSKVFSLFEENSSFSVETVFHVFSAI